jgi:hypothetical protein
MLLSARRKSLSPLSELLKKREKAPITAADPLECGPTRGAQRVAGEACPECSNSTLMRNGTRLKRKTCGATTWFS